MSSKNKKVANRVKISSSERKRSKRLRHSSSPLRERYLEDMRLHKFTERTIGSYLESVLVSRSVGFSRGWQSGLAVGV